MKEATFKTFEAARDFGTAQGNGFPAWRVVPHANGFVVEVRPGGDLLSIDGKPTQAPRISYKAEVIADSTGKWCSNGLRFATEEEAADYARDLRSRWILVRDWRVNSSEEPVNTTRVRA